MAVGGGGGGGGGVSQAAARIKGRGERGVPEDPCLVAGSAHCSLAGQVQWWQG